MSICVSGSSTEFGADDDYRLFDSNSQYVSKPASAATRRRPGVIPSESIALNRRCAMSSKSVIQEHRRPPVPTSSSMCAGSLKPIHHGTLQGGPNAQIQPSGCRTPIRGGCRHTLFPGDWHVTGNDTSIRICSPARPGQFVTALCEAGEPNLLGSNTETEDCRLPAAGQYISTLCVPGNSIRLGQTRSV